MIFTIIFKNKLMMNLEYIIENSGDSILECYKYSGGLLSINIDLGNLNKKVLIQIKTDSISFNNYYLDKNEDIFRTCRIEVQDLSKFLTIDNNIYVPSNSFGKFMNEKRQNFHLAYGEKIIKMKYIFSLVGYDMLLSCLMSDMDCITLEEIN